MARKIPWGIGVLLFVMVMPTFGQPCEGLVADLDGDGAVTFSDFFMLADQFGEKSEIGQVDSLGGEALNLKIGFSDSEMYRYVLNADGSNLLKIDGRLLSLSPDGSRITFVKADIPNARDNETVLANFDGGNPIKIADILVDVVWSPDGSRFAFSQGDRVQIVNRDRSRFAELQVQGGLPDYPKRVSWSPDGTKLLVSVTGISTGETIYELSNIGSPVKLPNLPPEQIRLPIVWSPDGHHLAFNDYMKNDIYTIDADGTNQKRISSHVQGDGNNLDLIWAENGRIYFSTNNGRVYSVKDDGTDVINHWDSEDEKSGVERIYAVDGHLSPDATQIAIVTYSGVSAARLYIRAVDSPDRTPIVVPLDPDVTVMGFRYTWSPRGHSMAIDILSGSLTDNVVVASTDGKDSIDLTNKLIELGNLESAPLSGTVSFHWYTPQTLGPVRLAN